MTELYVRQFEDEIVGPKHYKDLGDDLLITKIFYTIQGEGPFAGYPAVFIRLAGCNRGDKTLYGCQFCDTDFRFKAGKRMSVDQVLQAAAESLSKERKFSMAEGWGGPTLAIITGGEPMMQDNVHKLVEALIGIGWRVQIESNGDRLAPGFAASPLKEAHLVVSPKIQAKRDGYGYFRPEVLARAQTLKFLVDARVDSPYHRLPKMILDGDHHRKIMLSPITVYARPCRPGEVASFWADGMIDTEATRNNYAHAAMLATVHNVRVSLQTHLYLAVE